jgi:hypothetical protein
VVFRKGFINIRAVPEEMELARSVQFDSHFISKVFLSIVMEIPEFVENRIRHRLSYNFISL